MMSSITKEMKWSQASYTPRLLFEKYHDKLPLYVKVAKGVHGENPIDTFAQDEIIRVNEIAAQPRILVRNRKDQLFSIPADWPIMVRVLIKKDKKAKMRRLSDVVEQFILPVRVVFDKSNKWKFMIGNKVHTNKGFGEMDIVGYYTERYLKGNSILNGVLHRKVVQLPLYLGAHLTVAEGIVNGTEEEWKDLQEMYTCVTATIDFAAKNGTKDILVYNLERYKMNEELSQFVRSLGSARTTGQSDVKMERTDEERGKILPNMTMTLSIDEDRVKQNGGASSGATTTRYASKSEEVITTTEITETSVSTSAAQTAAQDDHDKSDSGKASGTSGSISSATKITSRDFQEDEGTQTDNIRSIVNVELKAPEESTTIKSSDSGVYVSKGIQADDAQAQQYPRVLTASRKTEEGFIGQDIGGPSVVYVPIRDPDYEAFQSWKMRNEMARRQALPMSFTASSNTLYAGDMGDSFDDYPTLQNRGMGRYGMALSGGAGAGVGAGGAHYGSLQPRRPLTQPLSQPLRYAGSVSGIDMNRREMISRVYTDFDDDFSRKPPTRRYDDVDALGDPPLYHGNSTSKVYIDGNYNDVDRPNLNGAGGMRVTMNSSSGGQAIGGSQRDLYDRGGLHIGLIGQDKTQRVDVHEEIRSDHRRQYGGADGGYPSSNGLVEKFNRDVVYNGGVTPLPSPKHPPRQTQKIRRRLSSSHKYANARFGDQREMPSQAPIDGNQFEHVSQDQTNGRHSRFDQYQSVDNVRASTSASGVKRSSSFVNVSSGRVSRGPSTAICQDSDAEQGARRSQQRSTSVEVTHRKQGSTQERQVRNRSKETRKAQRDLLPQYQHGILDSNPNIQYANGEINTGSQQLNISSQQLNTSSQQQQLNTSPQQLNTSSQQQLNTTTHYQTSTHHTHAQDQSLEAQSTKVDLSRSTSSGKYNVESMHQAGSKTQESVMPVSEMQEDSDTSSESSDEVQEDVVDSKHMQRKDGQEIVRTKQTTVTSRVEYKGQQNGSNTRQVQSSVQSIPELSDSDSSKSGSDSSMGVAETFEVAEAQRQEDVDRISASAPPPPPPPTTQTTVSYTSTKTTTSSSNVQGKESLHEELRKKINASKEASKTGINHQVVGNGIQHKSVSSTSRTDTADSSVAMTSLRQAYQKSPRNSLGYSADLQVTDVSLANTELKEGIGEQKKATVSQSVVTTRKEVTPSGSQSVTTTKEIRPSGSYIVTTTENMKPSGSQSVTTTKEIKPSGSYTVTTTEDMKPSGSQAVTTITTKEVKPAAKQAITTTKESKPSGSQTVTTSTTTTKEVKPAANQTTNTSSTRTTVVTSTTTKSESTSKVQMRKKSETTMAYEHDVRESIRQLDDFLKTQDGDNMSMDSQGSNYVMGEQLSVGPPNLESWHF